MTGRPSGTRGTRTRDSGRWSRSRTSRTPDLVTDGPVLRPDDAGYDEEVATFNLATAHRPEVVVGATGTADVVAAVCWARQAGLPVAVQATGHGANSPVDHGVMVNTRRMTGVRIDPAARTATIGAGAKWKAVIDAATPHGLAPLSGSSSDVGVVGYTVGGGLPVLGRAFGYAADMVRSFEVVTGDGQVQQVDAEHEPELFWALRGGKGNVGIVTSLVCGLVPLGRFYGGGVFFPGSAAPRLLDSYRQWTATLADTTCTALALLRLPPLPDIPEPLRGQFVVHLRFVHLGDRSEGEALLAPMRAVAPAIIDAVDEMGYADIDHVHQDPDHPVPAKENNTLLRELTPEAVDALLEVVGPDASSPLTIV
ncbi:MAG: FAD-binding oxidoreductase [Nocardioidaceae bacterium]